MSYISATYTPSKHRRNFLNAVVFVFGLLMLSAASLQAQDPFITIWQTDNPGTSNDDEITIPTNGVGYNYDVDWGDGNSDTGLTGDITHTYTSPGTYTVEISGSFPRIYFNNGGDKEKILSIEQWGDIGWTSMQNAFYGAFNLVINATDAPDLSSAIMLNHMFNGASSMNSDINHWDVSNVTNMHSMFYGASIFNQDLNSWDVSNVTIMTSMFQETSVFDGDISGWDVSSVTNMTGMFKEASSFNGDLSTWDVTGVTSMLAMFNDAVSFNSNISGWDVSGVSSMLAIFDGASAFNQDIGGWNVSGLTDMFGMFADAAAFDQDLGGWNVENVTSMFSMLSRSGLSVANYDATLTGWASQSVQSGVSIGVNDLEYCASEADRQSLIDDNGWNFMGDDRQTGCAPAPAAPFITTWQTDNPGTSNDDQISIPISGTNYDFIIDWGDGNISTFHPGDDPVNLTHTYLSAGTYTVEITGNFPRIYFNDEGDKEKILSVEQWGDIEWSSMENAFWGASNLVINASDAPGLSGVTSLTGMFRGAVSLNADLNHWDVSGVTSTASMFSEASSFNGDISSWDVSGVIYMSSMFFRASAFNGNIGGWDVSNVTSMNSMFNQASAFNRDISGWNVSNVTTMHSMFSHATAFDTSLSGWNVSNVTIMNFMFLNASSFSQYLGGWNITSVTSMVDMLNNTALPINTYDATLGAWSSQAVQDDVELGVNGLEYCSGADARDDLINNFNWIIIGDAPAPNCLSAWDPFMTIWKTDNPGDSSNDQIRIPMIGDGYDFTIEWGDGTDEDYVNNPGSSVQHFLEHTYLSEGVYTVEIRGDFPHIYINDEGDKEKILSVEEWGDITWKSMEEAFSGAANLMLNASDAPDLTNVETLANMFRNATAMNSDLNHWDVSGVTDMRLMFSNADAFNQNIDDWDTGNVTTMNYMFANTNAFNRDIGDWDISGVTNMAGMFSSASVFNQDLSNWDVSSVGSMAYMFQSASAFNQNLGGWDITGVLTMTNMLNNSGLSTANYDATLTGWAAQSVQNGVPFGANGLEYCAGEVDRQYLISDDGWIITGDVLAASCGLSVQLTGGAGWRTLSSPVEVSLTDLLGPIWTQGASGADYSGGDPNVWTWDNTVPGEDPADWVPVTDLSATVTAGTGVLVYVFDEDEYGVPSSATWPKPLSVSGTVNSLPQSPTINGNAEGFTLLGNPVNTGIDWNEFTLNEVQGTVYVWDPAIGDYVFWNGTSGDLTNGIIHPFQGFFVETSVGASSPSLTIPTSAATSPDDFFGKELVEEPLVVRLQLSRDDSLKSIAWLQFSEKGSLTRNSTDAVKLQPLAADYAVLGLEPFSDDESSLLALKHLPLEMQTPLEIPLTATATQGGTFTLAATDINLPDDWSLSLRDTRTGEQFELEQGTEYSFELEANERLRKIPPYQGGTEEGIQLSPQPRPLVRSSAPTKDVGTDGSQTRFLLTIAPAGAIEADLPEQIALEQNYPNPFNPSTVISYQLPAISQVRLEVYDMVGRRVATLVDAQVGAGTHQVNFNAGNLSSGIYLYRLQTSDVVFTKKLTLIK